MTVASPKKSGPKSGHFVRLSALDDPALLELLMHAKDLKASNYRKPVAKGKMMGLIFLNPSLRTRTSFEAALYHIGAGASVIQPGAGTWTFETREGVVMDGDRTEHLKEAVKVISRYVDLIGVRAFAEMKNLDDDIEDRLMQDIVEYATVPVINMESAREHPCQALADGLTLWEQFAGNLHERKFVLSWAPHPRPLPMAVPNSALEVAARLGMQVTLACPPEMTLDDRVLSYVRSKAAQHNRELHIEHDQKTAFENADVIYAKSWAGPLRYHHPEAEETLRKETYKNWTVGSRQMSHTRNARFMHCLPVRRNVVVTDEVLDGPTALHIGQAENRLHAQKALLMRLWGLR